MARRVVGLDLGAYSVKLVRLECGKQNPRFEIVDVAEEILLPDAEKDLIERQRDALAIFSQKGLLEAEMYSIGLSAIDGQMRTMQVPFLEQRKIEAVLPGILDAEIPFELDDMMTVWYRAEDEKVEEKPTSSKIRVAFGKKPVIAKTLQMLQSFAVNPRLMNLSSAAPYEIARELSTTSFKNKVPLDERSSASNYHALYAIIDFGHTATNFCVFDEKGLCFSRSFLRGGKKLTEEIAKALEISFEEAESLKHEKASLLSIEKDKLNEIVLAHHKELSADILRAFIAAKSTGLGEVKSVALIGGASVMPGLLAHSEEVFKDHGIFIVPFSEIFPKEITPQTALALAYSLSSLHIHAKVSRFNFRKDEFSWRGDLDIFRSKSTPLILWGLGLICSLILLYSANSMILNKENKHVQAELKRVCTSILRKNNVDSKKCLAMMKEQISTSISVGIPEFSASDVYLKTAEFMPADLKVTFSELDVLEKKVRISAKTTSFEDVDKAVANLKKVPCLRNIEKGRAQQAGESVQFTLSADIDCSATASKAK